MAPWARLRHRPDFLRIGRQGRRWVGHAVIIRAESPPQKPATEPAAGNATVPATNAQVGFTVSKKHGNAVCRNRARRRLREALRTLTLVPQEGNVVLIARPQIATMSFTQIRQDLTVGLTRVGMVKTRNNTENFNACAPS